MNTVELPKPVPSVRTFADQLYLEWRAERLRWLVVAAVYIAAFTVLLTRIGRWPHGLPTALFMSLAPLTLVWMVVYAYRSIKREWDCRAAYVLLNAPISPWALVLAKLTFGLTGYTALGLLFLVALRTLFALDAPEIYVATFLSHGPALLTYGLVVFFGTWAIVPLLLCLAIAQRTVSRYGLLVSGAVLAVAGALDWALQRWVGPLVQWRAELPGLILRQALPSGEVSTNLTGGSIDLWMLALKSLLGIALLVAAVWAWRHRAQVADGN